jgi:hypothetical protein
VPSEWLIDTVNSALGLFDAAHGSLYVARDALAVLLAGIAAEKGDALRIRGALEVRVARISHAVTA